MAMEEESTRLYLDQQTVLSVLSMETNTGRFLFFPRPLRAADGCCERMAVWWFRGRLIRGVWGELRLVKGGSAQLGGSPRMESVRARVEASLAGDRYGTRSRRRR